MYFSKLALFLPLLLGAVAFAAPQPQPEAEAAAEPDLVELTPAMMKRGFGCPFNRQQCNDHCISLKGGRTGGFCAGTFRTTCTCVKN